MIALLRFGVTTAAILLQTRLIGTVTTLRVGHRLPAMRGVPALLLLLVFRRHKTAIDPVIGPGAHGPRQ
jgi:hypothetical protein